MAAMPSLKLNFTVPYRGTSKTWSSKFHFAGGLPPDLAHWTTFADNVWASLKAGMRNDVHIEGFVGYANDTTPAVASGVMSGVGSIDASAHEYIGVSYLSANLSWTTDQRNSRGGPIYLRNFIHGAIALDLDHLDELLDTQQAALATFAQTFDAAHAGFSDGATSYHRAGPNGAVGLVGTCKEWIGHRVLARRG